MNKLDYFRNIFIPKASDLTIAQLIFLYNKFCNAKEMSDSEIEFIKELTIKLKKEKAEVEQ